MNIPSPQPNVPKTFSDFYDFFEAIPEGQWCAEPKHSGLRHSALGHLEIAYPFTHREVVHTLAQQFANLGAANGVPSDELSYGQLTELAEKVLEQACARKTHNFPFHSPKLRVLAMLKKCMDAYNQAVVAALQSSDGDLPEFSGM